MPPTHMSISRICENILSVGAESSIEVMHICKEFGLVGQWIV
jgi:hypothetical protein